MKDKVKAFRLEIRQRSNKRKMERVRLMYWLEQNTKCDEIISQFLLLVASCKMHSQSPSLFSFSSLLKFLESNCHDWNFYILLCQQIAQLGLINAICTKIDNVEIVCDFLSVIVLKDFNKAPHQQLREVAQEIYQNMMHGCSKEIVKRMLVELVNNLNHRKQQKRTRDQIVRIICFILSSCQDETVSSLNLFIKRQLGEDNFVMELAHVTALSLAELSPQNALAYLKLITFLLQNLSDAQNDAQMQEYSNEKSVFLELLQLFFADSNLKIALADNQPILSLTLLGCLEEIGGRHEQIISQAIKLSRESKDPFEGLACLSAISYKRKWLCYSHVKNLLLQSIATLREQNQNFLLKQPSNYEGMIIKIIINVLQNEYLHNCYYDCYEVLEQVCKDLLQDNILSEWSQNWRNKQYIYSLLTCLLNCKNDKVQLEIVKICSKMDIDRERRTLRRKIHLHCHLNHIQCSFDEFYDESYSQNTSENELDQNDY